MGGGIEVKVRLLSCFFGASCWNTLACFAVAAESGRFLLRRIANVKCHAGCVGGGGRTLMSILVLGRTFHCFGSM